MFPLKRNLSSNPLSIIWRSDPPCLIAPFAYVAGMVGYSLSLITRTLSVGSDAIILIARVLYSMRTLKPDHVWGEIKVGFTVLFGTIGEVCIAIIGVICPPLAYSLDERLYSHKVIMKHSIVAYLWGDQVHCRPRQALL